MGFNISVSTRGAMFKPNGMTVNWRSVSSKWAARKHQYLSYNGIYQQVFSRSRQQTKHLGEELDGIGLSLAYDT